MFSSTVMVFINSILKSIKSSGGVRDTEKLKERYKKNADCTLKKYPIPLIPML